MTFPRNEAETIQLFKLASVRLGWHLVHLQIAFPDAVIENERGQRLIAEFEFESKNFQAHGHDSTGCDLIICYKDDWKNSPVPVWALKDCAAEEVLILQEILTGFAPKEDLLLVQRGCKRASRKNNKLLGELSGAHEEISFLKKQTLYGIAWQVLCMLTLAMFIYHIWKY